MANPSTTITIPAQQAQKQYDEVLHIISSIQYYQIYIRMKRITYRDGRLVFLVDVQRHSDGSNTITVTDAIYEMCLLHKLSFAEAETEEQKNIVKNVMIFVENQKINNYSVQPLINNQNIYSLVSGN